MRSSLRTGRLITAAGLGLLLIFASVAPAAEVDENLVWKIAQIVLDTAAGKPVDGGPTEAQVNRFRAMGQNSIGPSWGLKKRIERSAVDGKPITLVYNVTIVDDSYEMSDAQKANWEEYGLKQPDEHSGAQIAFRAVKEGDVRHHRTIYRLQRDGYRLYMMVGRQGDESAEDAVKKTLRGWHAFYDNAERLGLFEPRERVIIRLMNAPNADHSGEVADRQVVHLASQPGERTKLRFKMHAEAPHLEEDEPYILAVQAKTPAGHAPVRLTTASGSALPDANGDGIYELHVEAPGADNAGEVIVDVDPAYAMKAGAGSYAAGPAVIMRASITKIDEDGNVTISPKGFKDVGVQENKWYPIVTRMEVHHMSQTMGGEGAVNSDNQSLFAGYSGSFSKLAGAVAELDKTFNEQIVPIASKDGQIAANDPVMLGWRLHPQNPDYVLIRLDQKTAEADTHVMTIPQGSKPWLAVWMEVVNPSVKGEDADFAGDGFGGEEGFDMGGGEADVDMETHQREFERQIHLDTSSLDNNGLWVTRIAYISPDKRWESRAAMLAEIRELIRLPAGGPAAENTDDPDDPISYDMPHLILKSGYNKFTDLREQVLTPDPVRMRELALVPGTYELRFRAKPYHINETGSDQARQIDVAIRFAVIPTRFNARLLEWETQRQE